MANAFQSLKCGIEADIKFMAENDFIDVDESIINEIHACMHLIKIGRNRFSPIIWAEAWKLYGLHNYSKINAFLEKQLQPKQKTRINLQRSRSIEEKTYALEAYVAPAPALVKIMEQAISDTFANEYADHAMA